MFHRKDFPEILRRLNISCSNSKFSFRQTLTVCNLIFWGKDLFRGLEVKAMRFFSNFSDHSNGNTLILTNQISI